MADASPAPYAVVTGASSGIGYELAKVFAGHGFDLLIAAEDADISVVGTELGALGAAVRAVQVDLATYEGIEQLYAAITVSGRPVDAVAINAGVGVGGRFVETDLAAERNLIALNVTSTVHLAKRVAVDMARRGEGRILFTSSIASKMPAPFEAVYGASKAFVQSFSQALRNELADVGVSVTALLPRPTETEFFDRAGMADTKVGASSKDDPAKVAEQGFEGLIAGKDQVLAGSLLSRLQGAASAITPEPMAVAAHRKLSEPGSA